MCVNPALTRRRRLAALQRFESSRPSRACSATTTPVTKSVHAWVSIARTVPGPVPAEPTAPAGCRSTRRPAVDPPEVRSKNRSGRTGGPTWRTSTSRSATSWRSTAIGVEGLCGRTAGHEVSPPEARAWRAVPDRRLSDQGSGGFLSRARAVQIGSAATSVNVRVPKRKSPPRAAATAPGSYEVAVSDAKRHCLAYNGPSYYLLHLARRRRRSDRGTASAVSTDSATIWAATVNPNGGAVSECRLEYGTTPAYGSSAPCTPSPGSGVGAVAVSASLAGLAQNTRLSLQDRRDQPRRHERRGRPGFSHGARRALVQGRRGSALSDGEGEAVPTIWWGTLTLDKRADGQQSHVSTPWRPAMSSNPGSGATGPLRDRRHPGVRALSL